MEEHKEVGAVPAAESRLTGFSELACQSNKVARGVWRQNKKRAIKEGGSCGLQKF